MGETRKVNSATKEQAILEREVKLAAPLIKFHRREHGASIIKSSQLVMMQSRDFQGPSRDTMIWNNRCFKHAHTLTSHFSGTLGHQ